MIPSLAIGLPYLLLNSGYLAWLIWREACGYDTEAECLKRRQAAQLRRELRR